MINKFSVLANCLVELLKKLEVNLVCNVQQKYETQTSPCHSFLKPEFTAAYWSVCPASGAVSTAASTLRLSATAPSRHRREGC